MEKEERRQEIVPLSFPDFSLTIPYAEALYYVQRRLGMLGRGDLKSFCVAQQFTYTDVVGLKNGTLKREEPRLVQRIMRSFELPVPVEVLRFPPNSPGGSFVLPDAGALATFQSQIAYLKSCE